MSNPHDLPLPREAPPSAKGRGIAAVLRRSLSGSITIPDSVSEPALKHRYGLRRLSTRLRDVNPSLSSITTSFVGMGGVLVKEIRGGVPRNEMKRVDTAETTTTIKAVPQSPILNPDELETVG
jgi:hypothetical protein